MKYSTAAVSAFVVAVAAKPQFLNSSFQVTEGEPFTLKYSGCDSGCTIILEDGPSSNLKEVTTLTSDASGSSTEVTIKDVPSGEYAFKIVDNSNPDEFNYSTQFPYKGSASASSSATSTEASSTASSTSASSTEASTTTETSTSASATTSSATTPTSSASATTTSAKTTSTKVPDSAAVRVDSSFALIAGAIAAMAYLN